ncbi:MAG: sensor histidine kinase [Cellulosilyticaceae bacterium]
MISIRKQLFALLLCVGSLTVMLTAIFVNVTIHYQFKDYVEQNIEKASATVVDTLKTIYTQKGSWDLLLNEELLTPTQVGNFSVAVLDQNKNVIWGMTEDELLNKIRDLKYPFMYGQFIWDDENSSYIFNDMPIYADGGELLGYARIGYFPSFLLSNEDIIFQANINTSIIWSGIIGLINFILIGVYITNLFTKPIYAIARTSVALAGGKYKTRYNKKSKIKEIENLRYSMNYLAETLEKQDELRKKLLSDVSHEIRTPLHILQSNLEAMIDGIYPIDEDQMQILYEEVVRFSKLLNNLNQLKNIEEQGCSVERTEIYINDSLEEVYRTFKIVAKEKKMHYTIDAKTSENVIILGDKDKLKQIWMNVFSNAFKFTDSGAITIKTKTDNRKVEIVIEDTGIGIAKEDLPYIFERMYRGDKSREQYEGSGIGLTLVKQLVMAHEGKIDIESAFGKGTKVIIQFPVHKILKSKSYKNLHQKY